MSDHEFNEIFSKNLNYYLTTHNKTQVDLARFVGVSTAAVNTWCKGLKNPRMDKIDKICIFFQINRSDLMEIKSQTEKTTKDHDFHLSIFEKKLITEYRNADTIAQTAVLRMLGIDEKRDNEKMA